MADKKVTQLTSLTTGASEDLFLVVDDPNGTPASKQITHKNLFGAVASNVVVSMLTTLNANVTINCSNTSISSNVNMTGSKGPKVTSGFITLNVPTTVSSNNTTTVLSAGGLQGSIFWAVSYTHLTLPTSDLV